MNSVLCHINPSQTAAHSAYDHENFRTMQASTNPAHSHRTARSVVSLRIENSAEVAIELWAAHWRTRVDEKRITACAEAKSGQKNRSSSIEDLQMNLFYCGCVIATAEHSFQTQQNLNPESDFELTSVAVPAHGKQDTNPNTDSRSRHLLLRHKQDKSQASGHVFAARSRSSDLDAKPALVLVLVFDQSVPFFAPYAVCVSPPTA